MTTLKQGDLIEEAEGYTRKVIEVCGTILFISGHSDHNKYDFTATETTLKACGYTWDTPAWEPSIDQRYWWFDSCGEVIYSIWNDDSTDHGRKDFLGIYETKELCEAALLEIRRKLGK